MNSWQDYILNAQRAGYRVEEDEEGGWWVITPAAPRRPSQTLGLFCNSLAAWKDAARLAVDDDNVAA